MTRCRRATRGWISSVPRDVHHLHCALAAQSLERLDPGTLRPERRHRDVRLLLGLRLALAFGGTFLRHGFAIGTLRILHRCWQVYWSHLGLFLSVATLSVLGTWWLDGTDYVEALYLQHFFAEPRRAFAHLVTLTYVPNYFDILPMYLVVLAMVPAVLALARIRPAAALGVLPTALSGADRVRLGLPCGMVVGARLVLQSVRLAADLLHRLRLRVRLAE